MLTIQCSQEQDRTLLQPVGELTIYTVGQAKQELINAMEGQGRLELDLSGLEEVDSAGIQLLFWLKQSVLQQGRSFTGHGPAMVEALKRLNLVERFGDPIPAPSHTR